MNKDKARFNMVEQQIRPWDVSNEQILNLMASLPRELFIPENQRALAFADLSISLPHSQKMFSPKEEARMVQSLSITKDDKALEIGTGTGFTSALIASLAKKLLTLDIYPEFIAEAETRFRQLNLTNITSEITDVSAGWRPSERYDVIAITPALRHPPEHYLKLLNNFGRLFCVEGTENNRYAKLYQKDKEGNISVKPLFEMDTPPMIEEEEKEVFVF